MLKKNSVSVATRKVLKVYYFISEALKVLTIFEVFENP